MSKIFSKSWIVGHKVEILLATFVILELFMSKYLVNISIVKGESMMPTMHNKDVILTYKPMLYRHKYNYGDIVIIDSSRIDPYNYSFRGNYYIKRIIGKPGDIIKIEGGNIFRNGKKIEEDYVAPDVYTGVYDIGNQWELSDNEYFVMGDNRLPNKSADSRAFGPILEKEMVGKAGYIFYPFDRETKLIGR